MEPKTAPNGQPPAEAERERLLQEAQEARAAADLERRRLLAVLEQLPVGVHVAEAPSGRLLFDNAAVRAIWGDSAPHSERIADYGADYAGYYPPGHPRAGERLASDAWPLARAIATGEPVHDERVEARRPDGTRRLMRVTATPIRDADGRIVGGVATDVDVTEQERLLAESEAARERVTAVLESIGDAFYAVDAESRFTYVNRRAEALWGRRRESLIGRHFWTEFPVAVGSESWRMHHQVMAERRPVHYETLSPVVGCWIDVSIYPEAGGGLACYFRDISDRREAEAAREAAVARAEAAQRRVAFLAASSGALAESLDPEAVLRTIARLAIGTDDAPGLADACVLTLATQQEARRGAWRTLIEGGDAERVALEMERQRRFPAPPDGPRGFPAVIRTGRSEIVTPEMMEEQLRVVAGTNEEHWRYLQALDLYSAVSAPLVARGRILGALTLVRHGPVRREPLDADDLALAQELGRRAALALDNARLYAAAQQSRVEAEAARAEAEQANRAKSEFLAVMSHELRTPLNAIGGYAELLEMGIRGPVTAQQREDLRRLQASQRHLLGLINEVLNYARLETGAVHYDVADVRVRDALAGAEMLVAPQARAKGLTLAVAELPPDLAVRADAEKLRQILVNLLSNAVKFTDPGGRVELACAEVADRVLMTVRDTGIGIAADQRERIFDPFVQVRADLTRTAEGTGLGLAISRDLARGMGGDLTVESEPGVGSVFTLALCRAAAGDAAGGAAGGAPPGA